MSEYRNKATNDSIRSGLDFVAANVDEIRAMLFRLCERMQYAHKQNTKMDAANAKAAIAGLVDDVFSECVLEVCDRVYNKFNPEIGNLRGYMFYRLQFCARKWFQTLRLRQSRFKSMQEHSTNYTNCELDECEEEPTARAVFDDLLCEKFNRATAALLDHEQVILYLSKLTEREERIVRMHAGYGQSFDEIAERIGGGVSSVRIAYNLAITRLRDLAKYDGAN